MSSSAKHPIVHWEILGPDGKRLQQFYGDLFNWKIDASNEWQYGMVGPDDSGVGGGIAAHPGGGTQSVIYVQTPDLRATLDEAVELGGKILMEPEDLGFVTIAQFADPAGNVVGLVKG